MLSATVHFTFPISVNLWGAEAVSFWDNSAYNGDSISNGGMKSESDDP
jgi:hypothetical protein